MYGDVGSARDMNYPLYSSTFKNRSDGEFAKIKELISSDAYSNHNHHEQNSNHSRNQNQNQNQSQNQQQHDVVGQNESSLTRYRSAPSSFFENLLECDDFLDPVDTSSNQELDERFFSSNHKQQQKFGSDLNEFLQFASSPMKLESEEAAIDQKLDLSPASRVLYSGGSRGLANLSPINSNNHVNRKNLECSSTFTLMNSTSSNLVRQSSSPAGFLSYVNAENGFSGNTDAWKATSSSRLNNHITFSSRPSSSPMLLPQIPKNRSHMKDYTIGSLKMTRDSDPKFSSSLALDTQNGESGHYTPSLVHHMSLPKISSEMANVERFLRFEQDTIPCKIRAKRGHATHPRSIAERVRRTRISERMKKLQELFPTMDKQTSTADMLDLAVEHIKDIQKELQTLNDAWARCTCKSKQL